MNAPSPNRISAIAWLVLSPVAAVMALISTVESQSTYYTQVGIFGLWSCLGMISGVGSFLRATWASRIQVLLVWIAVAYFSISGLLIVSYLVSAFINGGVANPIHSWAIAALVLVVGLLLFYRARSKKRQRSPDSENDTSIPRHGDA